MTIPVQNLYYLLSYAWDKLEEAEALNLDISDYEEAVNLFGRVLIASCNHIIKRGLDRAYISTQEDYSGVKGKINFNDTINKQLFNQGKVNCIFDEFTTNVIHNKVLKSTLRLLANLDNVDKKIKEDAWKCFHRFQDVDQVELKLSDFKQIHLHQNNAYYELPLNVARFLIENIVFDESEGKMKFKDFFREDKAMAALFEEFTRNFYAREQSTYRVRREDIKWQVVPLFDSDLSLLPKMQTDITLESLEHKLIIDAKYYSKTVSDYYGSEKLHSTNLYQLNAYLSNLERDNSNPLNSDCDGMLLYPMVDRDIDVTYQIGSHKMRVATIDLAQNWDKIHTNLLGFLSDYRISSSLVHI